MPTDTRETTPRPWFVHDFTDPAINAGPTPADVTISCTTPDSLSVAYMASGLTDTLDEARANAALIVRAVNNIDEVVEVLGKSRKALEEAEEILGGEYGDHYGPLCEMMIDLVNSHNALLSKLEASHGSA